MSAPAPTSTLPFLNRFFPGNLGVTQAHGVNGENGVDIGYAQGAPITSPFSGVITAIRGQLVALQLTGQSTVVYFQHLIPTPGLALGQQVSANQTTLGKIAPNTSRAVARDPTLSIFGSPTAVPGTASATADYYDTSGPHLEFGVQQGANAVANTVHAIYNTGGSDPFAWLAHQGSGQGQSSGGQPFIIGGLGDVFGQAANAINAAGNAISSNGTVSYGQAGNAIDSAGNFLDSHGNVSYSQALGWLGISGATFQKIAVLVLVGLAGLVVLAALVRGPATSIVKEVPHVPAA